MTTPIKIIRRRKSWPKWARWHARDICGGLLFSARPHISDYIGGSLRKIAPAGRK